MMERLTNVGHNPKRSRLNSSSNSGRNGGNQSNPRGLGAVEHYGVTVEEMPEDPLLEHHAPISDKKN
jgi:hypothetical protein